MPILHPRVTNDANADPIKGVVYWDIKKSIWVLVNYAATIFGIYNGLSWQLFALFLISTSLVLLIGHSVGMHRRFVHNSFECPLWLEYILVHVGVLVGLAGPYSMIKTHDIRDWAQRKPTCHGYFAHRQSFWRDYVWQVHCSIKLVRPPEIKLEERIASDPIFRFMEDYWMLQQLSTVIPLYLIGGWSWVVWGVCARISACVTGHWLIGYFAHRQGQRDWHVNGAGVQGYNLPIAALITMGESWHNNHHAFPGSAKLGLHRGQLDPGWWLLKALAACGLATRLHTPQDLPYRPGLRRAEIVWPHHCKVLAFLRGF